MWRWDNTDPFGANIPDQNPNGLGNFTFNPRFPGQYFDKETNLAYNYFRDYDPSTGRYIQSDPIGLAGGINAYAYVGSNPLSYFDFLGLCDNTKTCVGIALFSAVGPNQATGIGALSITPPMGSVALDPKIFGLKFPEGNNLSPAQLAQRAAAQASLLSNIGTISIVPEGLNIGGGPSAATFTVGDIGDKNIRNSKVPRFDIYRFDTQRNALAFGKQSARVTITIPDTYSCPPGFTAQ